MSNSIENMAELSVERLFDILEEEFMYICVLHGDHEGDRLDAVIKELKRRMVEMIGYSKFKEVPDGIWSHHKTQRK